METDVPEFEVPEDLRRQHAAATTPEQRVECMRVLMEEYSRWLEANPAAMDRYWRSNLRKRAIRGRPEWMPGGPE